MKFPRSTHRYVKTAAGWLYLAVVMDLFSRKIVGWRLADHMRVEIVINAFTMALGQRRPRPGLIHHSDRGSQYASNAFQNLCQKVKAVSSMSRKGNCWDNAPMESFFKTLKTELVYHRAFRNRAIAKAAIIEYITVFYNQKRFHSTLGYLSPNEFERRQFKYAKVA